MKNTGLDHSTWCVGSKMAWRGRLGRLASLGGTDGDRVVRAHWRLRAGGQNRSATIGSWGAAGGGKRCLPPIMLVMQGTGVFLSEQQNNPNRLHTNTNSNTVQDSINNTYDTIVLWLHTNPNCNVVQDSINNTYDIIVPQKTINCTYNVNAPRNKSQKKSDTNIEDFVRYRA